MNDRQNTAVTNLLDDRTVIYNLPPDQAVVAAFEEHDRDAFDALSRLIPEEHPFFKEYSRGYACGDWIAYKHEGTANFMEFCL